MKRRTGEDRPPMSKLTALQLLHRSSRYPDEDLSWLLGRVPGEDDFAEARALFPDRGPDDDVDGAA